MAADRVLDDEDFRLLTAAAFDFIFRNELKRAMRSQNYLTLLSIQATPVAAEESAGLTKEIARLVRRQVRETDLLSHHDWRRLSLVLLDTDLKSSATVVDRLMSRFEQYEFTAPTAISVGAACCPTHGTEADQLHRVAQTQEVRSARDHRGASDAQ
jgi:hypothetical protein